MKYLIVMLALFAFINCTKMNDTFTVCSDEFGRQTTITTI